MDVFQLCMVVWEWFTQLWNSQLLDMDTLFSMADDPVRKCTYEPF